MPAATCCRTCGGWVVIRGHTAEARPAGEDPSPGLKALATGILQAEAAYLGVSLNATDVLPRRAEGAPAVHLAEAADQLLGHLAAIEETILPDQGILAVLARAGAQLLVSGIELDGAHHAAQRLWGPGLRGVVVAGLAAVLPLVRVASPPDGRPGRQPFRRRLRRPPPLSSLPHGGPGRPWPG